MRIYNTNNLESHNVDSIAKQTAEHLCSLYHDEHGLNISIARCLFFRYSFAIKCSLCNWKFLQNVMDDKDIIINLDGNQSGPILIKMTCQNGFWRS